MGRLCAIVAAAGLLAIAAVPPATAASGKTSVCHYNPTTATYSLIVVSNSAVETHFGHGDGLPGGPVPGRGPVERIFAVAWTDLDGDHAYDAPRELFTQACSVVVVGDVPIARLIDGNGDSSLGAGDLVIADRYPISLVPAAPGDFGAFTVTRHVVSAVDGSGGRLDAFDAAGNRYEWVMATAVPGGGVEAYTELTQVSPGVVGAVSGVIDQHNGYGDAIVMDPASPSAPISAVAVQSLPNATDDALVDVYLAP